MPTRAPGLQGREEKGDCDLAIPGTGEGAGGKCRCHPGRVRLDCHTVCTPKPEGSCTHRVHLSPGAETEPQPSRSRTQPCSRCSARQGVPGPASVWRSRASAGGVKGQPSYAKETYRRVWASCVHRVKAGRRSWAGRPQRAMYQSVSLDSAPWLWTLGPGRGHRHVCWAIA